MERFWVTQQKVEFSNLVAPKDGMDQIVTFEVERETMKAVMLYGRGERKLHLLVNTKTSEILVSFEDSLFHDLFAFS